MYILVDKRGKEEDNVKYKYRKFAKIIKKGTRFSMEGSETWECVCTREENESQTVYITQQIIIGQKLEETPAHIYVCSNRNCFCGDCITSNEKRGQGLAYYKKIKKID